MFPPQRETPPSDERSLSKGSMFEAGSGTSILITEAFDLPEVVSGPAAPSAPPVDNTNTFSAVNPTPLFPMEPFSIAVRDIMSRDEAADVSDDDRATIIALARDLINVGLDARKFLEYGNAAQQIISTIPDSQLSIVRDEPPIVTSLVRIIDLLKSITSDDLMPVNQTLGAALFRKFAPPTDRLGAVILAVESEIRKIQSSYMADLISRLAAVSDLLIKEGEARRSVRDHILAGKITLAYYEIKGISRDFALGALVDTIDSLRISYLGNSVDAPLLEKMRAHYTSMINQTNGVIYNLVTAWKRKCTLTISAMQSRTGDLLSATRDLLTTQETLAHAIQKIITPSEKG